MAITSSPSTLPKTGASSRRATGDRFTKKTPPPGLHPPAAALAEQRPHQFLMQHHALLIDKQRQPPARDPDRPPGGVDGSNGMSEGEAGGHQAPVVAVMGPDETEVRD